jgi:hypothetical protein
VLDLYFAAVANGKFFGYIADVCDELVGPPSVVSKRLPAFPYIKVAGSHPY